MGKEIERKFLVKDDSFIDMASASQLIEQGYISLRKEGVVRVRTKGDKAYITVKGLNHGAVRDEWEYEIPVDDARQMLQRVTEGVVITKRRYYVNYKELRWEIDVFGGTLEGLKLAEVELAEVDAIVELPPFVGDEVTDDPRYYNSSLSALG